MIHYAWMDHKLYNRSNITYFAYLQVKQNFKIRSVTCDFYGAHKQINLSMYVKLPINACIDYETASIGHPNPAKG
mgnify:CR=1 FL=1